MRFIRESIRNKLIVFLLVAITVPIAASMVITYHYTKESLKDRTIEENTHLMFQGKVNLLHYTDAVSRASLAIYNDPAVYNILDQGLADYESESKIYTGLQNISRAVKEIYQVHLYVSGSKKSYLFIQDNFKRSPPQYKPHAIREPYIAFVEPTHMSHDYDIRQLPYYSPEPVFTIHRPIHRVPGTDLLGFLSIDVKLDVLRDLSSQLYDAGKEQLDILDENGTVIYSSDASKIGKASQDDWALHIRSLPAEQGNLEWRNSQFSGIMIYDKMTTPYMNWTLVKRIPYDHLYQNARHLTLINLLVAGAFLAVAAAATILVSVRFTEPIKQLIRFINIIQSGQLETQIHIDRRDEIGILARRFRTMMRTFNDLILREYKLDLANKTNQLKALQAQINPHFLNNALQSIGTLALQHEAPKVYSLISSLAKMMHYGMNTKEAVVPLSKELDHVRYYLELQQQRFEDKVQYEFRIGEGTAAVPVPKMILQPIVENYFKHGFTSQRGGGSIVLTTELAGNELQIEIADNGIGMSEEKLQLLQQELERQDPESGTNQESIGLANVMSRLRLYYGREARIELTNRSPHGLAVTLAFPAEIRTRAFEAAVQSQSLEEQGS